MSAPSSWSDGAAALNGARAAVGRGWRVLPVRAAPGRGRCACGPSCKPGSEGKHPIVGEWQKRASADPTQLERWARQHRGCNWGVATGPASGLYVVDLDLGEDGTRLGEQTWRELFGDLPDTLRVRTGSGASQLYFRYPDRVRADGQPWGNTSKAIGPGVDTRGDRGQCVLPGSVSGKGRYSVEADRPVAVLPDAVLDRLEAAERGRRGARGAAASGAGTGQARASAARPALALVRGDMHPWAAQAFAAEVAKFRDRTTENSGRTTLLIGAALRLSSLANATPATGITEQAVRDVLRAAAEDNGFARAHGAAYVDEQLERAITDGRRTPASGWPPPPPRAAAGATLTFIDVHRLVTRCGMDRAELAAELDDIDPGLAERIGAVAFLRGEPDDRCTELDLAMLDTDRAAVIAGWAAAQASNHVAQTRAGRPPKGAAAKAVAERWGPLAGLWCRGRALGGIGYHPESGLVPERVAGQLAEAARASSAGELADHEVDRLADAVLDGWDAGLAVPLLPLDPDDPALPVDGRTKRGVLPTAAKMAAAAQRRAGGVTTADRAGRPDVVVNGRDLAELCAEIRRHLAADADADPAIFLHGGELVVADRDGRLHPVDRYLLAEELARRVRFLAVGDDGALRSARPPADAVAALHSGRAMMPLPRLDRVARVPFFTPSGTWWTTAGYCAEARTLLVPDPTVAVPAVPERPTPAQVAAARRLITVETLGDFPFVSDADRAAAVGLMLLPITRPMITGPTPLHGIDAPTRGSGKGLLARACLIPALGDERPEIPQVERAEEWPKTIIAALRAGTPLVWLDNLDRPLSSATVASALTAWPMFTGRILGLSAMADLPAPAVWLATANNLRASSEIARRTVRIRIDPQVERPEDRGGFRHPHLERWVSDHRGELIAACATLVRAWQAAGTPCGTGRLGSYTRWLEVIGGILEHADIPGLLTNRDDWLATADGEDLAWSALVQVWAGALAEPEETRTELTAGELLAILDGADVELPFDLPPERFSPRQRQTVVGKALAAQRGRRFGDWRIDRRPTPVRGRVLWRLAR